MSLPVPYNFQNDVEGKSETELIPVIVLGNIETTENTCYPSSDADGNFKPWVYLSTNDISLKVLYRCGLGASGSRDDEWQVDHVERQFIPSLLSIPSLKESINVQDRKYKISNLNFIYYILIN